MRALKCACARGRRVRALLVLLLLVPLAGCAKEDARDRAPDATVEDEAVLANDSFFVLPVDESEAFRMRANVSSASGEAFDAWLLTAADCAVVLGRPRFDEVAAARDVTNATLERAIDTARGCLVLDNSEDDFGGAAPTGEVRVRYRIDVWR